MDTKNGEIFLSEDDLKEIFALFSSVTQHEKNQAYGQDRRFAHSNIDLDEEYQLSEPKRDFALDAWRAVLSFLMLKGVTIDYKGSKLDARSVDKLFL